jgi:hypothetical protein
MSTTGQSYTAESGTSNDGVHYGEMIFSASSVESGMKNTENDSGASWKSITSFQFGYLMSGTCQSKTHIHFGILSLFAERIIPMPPAKQ